ncbi:alpha/beta fold hydrolase [Actinacidiphila glaucinigra]|uniref:alpha/beta fold hydrolase n=1 Tax=Actinacidiphila glaucinigra TaxID=235986 RepID=UPI0035E02CB7
MSHRRPVRRVRLAGVGAVGLALAAGLATTASATQDGHGKPAGKPAPKPTVVLVHGAWADSAGWTGVAKRLQADGYPVAAPATPLRGLGSDAAYLADYLKTIKGPVVLVGHSYGGAVVTGAATGNDNVKALVYVAAFAPDKGESIADLVGRFPGSHLSDDPNAPVPTALNAVPFTQADGGTGVDLYIKPDKFRDVFLSNRVSRSKAAALAATQRPITAQAVGEPSAEAPAWKTIPSWYLVARADRTIPPAAERFMAARAHARTIEVDGPHAVHVTDPGAVTRLIEKAAATTR